MELLEATVFSEGVVVMEGMKIRSTLWEARFLKWP